jgi:hypothetical protein
MVLRRMSSALACLSSTPTAGELRRQGLKIRLPDQSFQILKELLSRSGKRSPANDSDACSGPRDRSSNSKPG